MTRALSEVEVAAMLGFRRIVDTYLPRTRKLAASAIARMAVGKKVGKPEGGG